MTSNGSPQSAGARLPAAGTRALKAIRRALGGFLLVALALGAYLYFYATHQQSYLTGRNLRVLASMSTQVGAKLQSAELFVKSAWETVVPNGGVDSAAQFIPAYQHLALGKRVKHDLEKPIFTAPNAQSCTKTSAHVKEHGTRWHHDPMAPAFCLHRSFEYTLKGIERHGTAYLNLATYLGPDLEARGGFDKTLVVDSSGRVLVEAGSPDVTVTRLDALAKGTGRDSAVDWARLSIRSSISEVSLAGKTYRLFLEPCCRLLDGRPWDQPLLVAGLVDKRQFVRGSLQISLSLLTLVSGLLVLAVLALPFLKFRLMGERQSVRLADGSYLGLAGFLAAGLITIFALDLYWYTKYRAIRDESLRTFSTEVTDHLRREIAAARDELDTLYHRASKAGELTDDTPARVISKSDSRYKFFESWAVISDAGRQVRKWSTDAYVQPMARVPDRPYFVETKGGRTWAAPIVHAAPGDPTADTSKPYFLESTLSRTTGKRQAVLAIPTRDTAGPPVATIVLEMVSLINTIRPPDYGFAVLNESGRVLFHSDPRRNLDERFFAEADEDRRLRSAVLARSVDTLNLSYGGPDHRAYVAPVPDLPWTLVTFLDKGPARVANAETLLGSMTLLLLYSLLLGILVTLVLINAPGYRAPWLWPDRRLYRGYVRLVMVNGLFLAAFLAACVGLERDDLVAAGILLPLTALAANWAVLARERAQARPDARPTAILLVSLFTLGAVFLLSPAAGRPHLWAGLLAAAASALALLKLPEMKTASRSIAPAYLGAAVLFLLVVGAMPAAAFFQVARQAHTEMLIKGGHLHLARTLEQRADSVRAAYSDELGRGKSGARESRLCTTGPADSLCGLDLYYDFFFGIKLNPPPAVAEPEPPGTATAKLVGLFLDPYRPSTSVAWRGTQPAGAADGAWGWTTNGAELQFRGSPAPGHAPMVLGSTVPGLAPGGFEDYLTAALLAGVILWTVYGIATFLARRLFLIDVTDPVVASRDRRIASLGGTNLFVVCRDSEEEEKVSLQKAKVFDLQKRLGSGGTDLRWVVESVREGDMVLLQHFEYRQEDKAVTEAKLNLLDTLVHEYHCSVVAVSGQHPEGSPLGLRAAWRLIESGGQSQSGAAAALESLVVVDAGRWLDCPEKEDRRRPATGGAGASSTAGEIIAQESRCDRHLQKIWMGLQQSLEEDGSRLARQGREELLDVMGERAEAYYRGVWESCRPAERSVLVHLASTGLVNAKDRRLLRRLLARGLVRRQPNFVVMNESFRRYLLGRADEIEATLPPSPSAWDAVRQPVMVVGTAVVILLFVTQQELFGATTALAAALASGVASMGRISGLFDRRPAGRESA